MGHILPKEIQEARTLTKKAAEWDEFVFEKLSAPP